MPPQAQAEAVAIASPAPDSAALRWLKRLHIRTRIAVLMVLAAAVAVLLATLGVRGLAASQHDLRTVYEDRMEPVRDLSKIVQLMLENQWHMQRALAQALPPTAPTAPTAQTEPMQGAGLERTSAHEAAAQIERNAAAIDALWVSYQSVTRSPQEQALAQQFGQRREHYLHQAITPVVGALRALDYANSRQLADNARVLYEQAYPDMQALVALQFSQAQAAYQTGVQRYERTGWLALGAIALAILVLGRLGVLLMRSIGQPLQHLIALCQKIAGGQLDNPVPLKGRDEISAVFRALHAMQEQLRESAHTVHQLAYYDALTQLPNRTLLRQRIEQALQIQSHCGYRALFLVDLDNFKTINDSLGHEIGDQHLQHVAHQLRIALGDKVLVARLGGDEFVVLATDLDPNENCAQEQARVLAQNVLVAVGREVHLAGRTLHTSASVGVCLFRPGAASVKDLLKRADTAMYQAKGAGRNAYRFYNPLLQVHIENRATLEVALRGAIEAGELALHYQLQVNAQRQPVGVEALLRWHHPHHGPVSPAQFIPIAENSDLIVELGRWVLNAACTQLCDWAQQPTMARLAMSVNVSARQFAQPDFVDQVCMSLAKTGARADLLVLELTESMVLHDVADTVYKMQALRRLGVRFALDDFGTGYSSLSQLQRLPLYQLKIDRSFIQDMGIQANDAIIVQTIVGMARNLGLDVVAEGVETSAQYQMLAQLGCPHFQGYLFTPPQPAAALQLWLQDSGESAAGSPPSDPLEHLEPCAPCAHAPVGDAASQTLPRATLRAPHAHLTVAHCTQSQPQDHAHPITSTSALPRAAVA